MAILAFASLASGSWVGIGAPIPKEARELASGKMPAPAPARTEEAASSLEDTPPTSIDPARLPDPSPWPRLNVAASVRRAWLLAEGPFYAPGEGRHLVTLTFDDGPFPETTPAVLRLLARSHVKATFFVVGRYLDGDEPRAVATREVLKTIVAEGHLVGNHTHDHQLLTTIEKSQALAQIDDGAASIEKTLGKRPLLFRPPYGRLDPWGMQLIRDRKLELVLWSVEVADMTHDDSQAMFESLKTQIEFKGGGVVLLHDIRPSTIPALASLLDWLRDRRFDPRQPSKVGYDVVDLPSYIKATDASQQPYADRVELEKARNVEWVRLHPKRRAPVVIPSERIGT